MTLQCGTSDLNILENQLLSLVNQPYNYCISSYQAGALKQHAPGN
jgi:hypothetical protein